MIAIEELTVKQFFAGLYAHTDIAKEPILVADRWEDIFSTKAVDKDGKWLDLMSQKNSSSDISCTAAQMPRLIGLGLASKIYRKNQNLKNFKKFSNKGNEVAFGTIGDASTSEGVFWESINAAAVLEIPVVMSVWDDGFGISVPKKYQTTKESISKALAGFELEDNTTELKFLNAMDGIILSYFLLTKKRFSFQEKNINHL